MTFLGRNVPGQHGGPMEATPDGSVKGRIRGQHIGHGAREFIDTLGEVPGGGRMRGAAGPLPSPFSPWQARQ